MRGPRATQPKVEHHDTAPQTWGLCPSTTLQQLRGNSHPSYPWGWGSPAATARLNFAPRSPQPESTVASVPQALLDSLHAHGGFVLLAVKDDYNLIALPSPILLKNALKNKNQEGSIGRPAASKTAQSCKAS